MNALLELNREYYRCVSLFFSEPGAFNISRVTDNVVTNASLETAQKVATAAHVLLKNDGGLLPLPTRGKRIAVLGLGGRAVIVGPAGSGSGKKPVFPGFVLKMITWRST